MLKFGDIFLNQEGQQLDFSQGQIDFSDVFNSGVAEPLNNILTEVGIDNDPVLEDIENNASQAQDDLNGLVSSFGGEAGNQSTSQPAESFGFERSSNSGGFDFASFTFENEARRDSQGNLSVFTPPSGDGGGSFEVAGITQKFQPREASELKSLIEQGRQGEAEAKAKQFFKKRAEPFVKHTSQKGLQLQLTDAVHHRGEGGLRRILQRATGSNSKNHSELIRKLDNDRNALDKFNKARVDYELEEVDRGRPSRAKFRKGLLNRFAKANNAAQQIN